MAAKDVSRSTADNYRTAVRSFIRFKGGRAYLRWLQDVPAGKGVELEKCMPDILEKYREDGTDYLFPILYKVKDGKIMPVSYFCALRHYNRLLKTFARRADIPVNLTSYTARHSWASISYEEGVGLPVISKAPGHADTQTTLIYIEGINDERPAKANRELPERIGAWPVTWTQD